jgi:hypothetical protein
MDSSFSDIEDIPENLEIQPYMFEPPARVDNYAQYEESSEESEEEVSIGEVPDRRLNTIW